MSKVSFPDLPDDVVLSVRNVSKKFCRNLRRSMWYGIQDLSRNLLGLHPSRDLRPETLDPRLEVEEGEDDGPVLSQSKVQGLKSKVSHPGALRRDEFWALQDINFDIKRGEAVGIIGVNGSGKTTLLRLIHGIFPPDSGEIAMKGKIGALISLGAGFDPHMTGRENVFLNGAILGIPQDLIRKRLADIINFAEIGQFIDAPVSTYSSGMRVRLGFSIAINMDPDILLVDEVLAVGDLTFRNKCVRAMRKLLSEERTILFVTHNMRQVNFLCSRAIFLDGGGVLMDGPSGDIVAEYYRRTNSELLVNSMRPGMRPILHAMKTDAAAYVGAWLLDESGNSTNIIEFGKPATIRVAVELKKQVRNPWVNIFWQPSGEQQNVAFSRTQLRGEFCVATHLIDLRMQAMILQPGLYGIGSRITDEDVLEKLAGSDEILTVQVLPKPGQFPQTNEAGFLALDGCWAHSLLDRSCSPLTPKSRPRE